MALMKNSLAVAIEALSWMAYAGTGERAALFKAADELEVKEANELRQAYRVIMETTRFQNRLDYLISQVISKDEIERTPHGIRSFLKIIAYLKHVDGTRQSVLERQVELARQILGWKEIRVYEERIALIVAGRRITKDSLTEFERLSLETCHPVWFVERLVNVFGRSFALRILRRDLFTMPAYVRLNSLKPVCQAAEIAAEFGGLKVEGVDDVFRLGMKGQPSQLIKSGGVVVQDLASITAGLVASPKPGQIVIDLCAAPGNKTTHAAAQMQNRGQIYSVDVSARRLAYWKKEMERCGCEIARPIRADARRLPLKTSADVVIVDPPCSNSGVFARSPAGKWKLTPTRVREYGLRQYSIIQNASDYVSPSGTLVYCTCSILPEENECVIEEFLSKNPDFKVARQTPFLGSIGLRGFDLCQRFYPHIHECNGYFIAKLQRIG
jgi:16S rRNA C967 or C1407 C5-methylase (RsmB/RsmF family)